MTAKFSQEYEILKWGLRHQLGKARKEWGCKAKTCYPPLLRAGIWAAVERYEVNCGLDTSPEFPPLANRGSERCVLKRIKYCVARLGQGVRFA